MGTLRMKAEAFDWFRDNPTLWWSAQARWAMNRVAPGLPGVETDERGEPTGWVVFAHHDIDEWDQIILDVCLAGMAYAQALPPADAAALVAYQADKDRQAFLKLVAQVQAGQATKADALRIIKLEVIRQAGVLGVRLPDLDDDLNVVPPRKPAESATKAVWVEWATAVGIDTDGTKAEIIERASGHP